MRRVRPAACCYVFLGGRIPLTGKCFHFLSGRIFLPENASGAFIRTGGYRSPPDPTF
jgi:hypothetical protein